VRSIRRNGRYTDRPQILCLASFRTVDALKAVEHDRCCNLHNVPLLRVSRVDTRKNMKATDVSFLIESLHRRSDESPEWATAYLNREVSKLADLAEEWLESDEILRHGMVMVRSLILLRRPRAALSLLDRTMHRLTSKSGADRYW
jgi:hypothetical protein